MKVKPRVAAPSSNTLAGVTATLTKLSSSFSIVHVPGFIFPCSVENSNASVEMSCGGVTVVSSTVKVSSGSTIVSPNTSIAIVSVSPISFPSNVSVPEAIGVKSSPEVAVSPVSWNTVYATVNCPSTSSVDATVHHCCVFAPELPSGALNVVSSSTVTSSFRIVYVVVPWLPTVTWSPVILFSTIVSSRSTKSSPTSARPEIAVVAPVYVPAGTFTVVGSSKSTPPPSAVPAPSTNILTSTL